MREAHPEIEEAGARVVAVGTGADFQAQHLERDGMPFPCLVDPDANLYRAIGIGRVGWTHWLRPDVAVRYVRAIRRGARQGKVTGDARRLSGVAVVRPDRSLAWLHRSASVGDYPPVADVLAAVRAATR